MLRLMLWSNVSYFFCSHTRTHVLFIIEQKVIILKVLVIMKYHLEIDCKSHIALFILVFRETDSSKTVSLLNVFFAYLTCLYFNIYIFE